MINANTIFLLENQITYQSVNLTHAPPPYFANVMEGEVNNDLVDDDFILNFISSHFSLYQSAEELKLSKTPSYAPNPDGLDKTNRSLMRDVVLFAFNQTGLPDDAFDFVHLSNDEPISYDAGVKNDEKLFMGKSQEDLKWMYDNGENNAGIVRILESEWAPFLDAVWPATVDVWDFFDYYGMLSGLSDGDGRSTKVYSDQLYLLGDYTQDDYKAGRRSLFAAFVQRRVQDVADFLPGVKCVIFGDMFDPEHIGGYYELEAAVDTLANKTITVQGTVVPMQEKLVFMPWLYPNTFTQPLEGELVDAEIENSVTRSVVGASAGWVACQAIPITGLGSLIARNVCRRRVARWAYEEITEMNSVDVEVKYEATGSKYAIDNSIGHFMRSGFPVVYMNSVEKEYITSHTLAQMVKVLEAPQNYTPQQRDDFLLGYATVAWGNLVPNNGWEAANDAYDQHFTWNNIEIFSAHNNWGNPANSHLMFGDVQPNVNINAFWSQQRISVTDYFATKKDLFNTYLETQANAPIESVNFFDAITFCNLLSQREGLDPVYTLTNITYNSMWNTTDIDGTPNQWDVKGPSILSATVQADESKDGYRLPTVDEIKRLAVSGDLTIDPTVNEWIWRGDVGNLFTVYDHGITDTATPADVNRGLSFRVVRKNAGIPGLQVFSKDEGLAEPNISEPRVYVKNESSSSIRDFTVHYYFTIENGKTPFLQQYYVPGSVVSLNQLDNEVYEISYHFAGELEAGEVLPVLDGNVVGIHFGDWSFWDKSNDYSFNNSSVFALNENIVITDNTGFIIFGEPPAIGQSGGGNGGTPPSQPNIVVYSKDEALREDNTSEDNITKPRLFVQNASSASLSGFTVHYYFTVDNNKTPILEQYWVPGSVVTMNHVRDNIYEISYEFSGELAGDGAVIPDVNGNAAGIHYEDWSVMDRTNDHSFNNSATFMRNDNIVVTDAHGNVIYGTQP